MRASFVVSAAVLSFLCSTDRSWAQSACDPYNTTWSWALPTDPDLPLFVDWYLAEDWPGDPQWAYDSIQRAAHTWNTHAASRVQFRYSGTATTWEVGNGVNEVRFWPSTCDELTHWVCSSPGPELAATVPWTGGPGELTESDIVFFGENASGSISWHQQRLLATATHEFGHFLALGHVPTGAESIMQPSGSLMWPYLAWPDVECVRALYGYQVREVSNFWSNDEGQSWHPNAQVLVDIDSASGAPAVAAHENTSDMDEAYLVAWPDRYYRIQTVLGEALWGFDTSTRQSHYDYSYYPVAITYGDGKWVLVWVDYWYDLYSKVSTDGQFWGNRQEVLPASSGEFMGAPAVTYNDYRGLFLAAAVENDWQGHGTVIRLFTSSDGETWSEQRSGEVWLQGRAWEIALACSEFGTSYCVLALVAH